MACCSRFAALLFPPDLIEMGRLLIAQPLLVQRRADASPQQGGIERLGQVVLGAQLDAAHSAVDRIERRDHDHRDAAQRRVHFKVRSTS